MVWRHDFLGGPCGRIRRGCHGSSGSCTRGHQLQVSGEELRRGGALRQRQRDATAVASRRYRSEPHSHQLATSRRITAWPARCAASAFSDHMSPNSRKSASDGLTEAVAMSLRTTRNYLRRGQRHFACLDHQITLHGICSQLSFHATWRRHHDSHFLDSVQCHEVTKRGSLARLPLTGGFLQDPPTPLARSSSNDK